MSPTVLFTALLLALADTPAPVTLTAELVPASAPAQAPATTSPSPDGRPLEVDLARPLTLTITATGPSNTQYFPPLRPAVGTFALGDPLPGTEVVDPVTTRTTWRWRLVPVRTGVEKLPPIEIPFRTPDGHEGSVSTDLIRVLIRGDLENESDPALGDAPPPVDIVTTNWALIWALSVAGSLVFAALASWLLLMALRQRFERLRPAPPPRPAIDVALERLDALDASPDASIDSASRLASTVDVLRQYLSGRYGIDALESTSVELSAILPTLDLRSVSSTNILSLLEEADLVKFARLTPGDAQARAKSPEVRHIVTTTWVPPEPAEDTPTQRMETASFRQRTAAAAIDLALAGALGLVAMGALWFAQALAWGFSALVLVALLLILRDAFGPSPGKRLLRLRVALRDPTQSPAPLAARLRRNALFALWPFTLPLEGFILHRHPLTLRLGDLWADTEVVRAADTRPGGPR